MKVIAVFEEETEFACLGCPSHRFPETVTGKPPAIDGNQFHSRPNPCFIRSFAANNIHYRSIVLDQ